MKAVLTMTAEQHDMIEGGYLIDVTEALARLIHVHTYPRIELAPTAQGDVELTLDFDA